MIDPRDIQPKRIIQIVSGSRSGSSLLKSLLALSPDVVSLAGEEEPYVRYSGNGYGITSESDSFNHFDNASLFRRAIGTELGANTWYEAWEWRLRLQFRGPLLAQLLNNLPVMNPARPWEWLEAEGVVGHYDGCDKDKRIPFSQMTYEMPPYVMPKVFSYNPLDVNSTLLLKSPYKVYRQGALERVFPDSKFTYIVLLRNPAATINGLIDGWEANYGFHKHLTPHGWWKFDMPKGWDAYVTAPVAEKAWFQWMSSYTIVANEWINGKLKDQSVVVQFEQLLDQPTTFINKLCKSIDITPPKMNQLPMVMTTEKPSPGRWLKRASTITPLVNKASSQELVRQLGILGSSSTWL